MVTLEIVKRLTEGNIYFSAYNAMLSTSDHSRHYPLNIQTAVCCFRKQIWADCAGNLFLVSPQDGMVQLGKAKVFPQLQVGPVADPSVVTGFPEEPGLVLHTVLL